jgi:hypothetical protein
MKVALLLSGKFRDGNDCIESIQSYIIKKYNADVFIDYSFNQNDTEADILDRLKILYKPKKISYGTYPAELENIIKNSHFYKKNIESNPESLFKMWYSIKKANELKTQYEIENGFEYDIVIKSRFDLKILDNINFKKDFNSIFIPIGWDHRDGYNDLFAYGDSKSMDYYCNLYNYLINYLKDGHLIHPETLLKVHLNKSKIVLVRTSIKTSLRGLNTHELEYVVKNVREYNR